MSDHTQPSRPDVVGPGVRVREAAMDEMVADAESMGLYDEDPDEIREALRLARQGRNRA
ncbi:MAG TPA: hypothetical protein VIM19_11960 [Actinomycetes bacterium]